jgi:hypothetical protein
MIVIDAIEHYARANGRPPVLLAELVPAYLSVVPKTGMAAYLRYEYEATSGDCAPGNKWHLRVPVHEFIDLNRLLHCPAQDYGPAKDHVLVRTTVGSWVHDIINF